MKRTFKIATAFFLSMIIFCSTVGCAQDEVVYKEAEYKTIEYKATATIMVTNGAATTSQDESTDEFSIGDISASLYLTYTIVDIINTPENYIKVAEELNKDGNNNYFYQDLMDCSTITRRGEDTLFIDITFSSADPEEAVLFANTFAKVSCKHILNIVPSAKPRIAEKATSATLVE